MKRLIFLPLFLAVIISGCSVKTAEDYYKKDNSGEYTAAVSINCKTAVKYKGSKRRKAEILNSCRVKFNKDDTVFTALKKVCKNNKIQFEYKGSGDSVYIEGIDYLYEFDCGDLSGWEYSVNGKFPSVGCNAYKLKDGDIVKWQYTCDLGADIGNRYKGS